MYKIEQGFLTVILLTLGKRFFVFLCIIGCLAYGLYPLDVRSTLAVKSKNVSRHCQISTGVRLQGKSVPGRKTLKLKVV
jgi:hypothetical protein